MNRQSAGCVATEACEEVCQLEPMRMRREMRRRLSSASQYCSCEMEEIWKQSAIFKSATLAGSTKKKTLPSTLDVWR